MPRILLTNFAALPYPILDVRAPAEFAQGHQPGAISLPLFSDEERAYIGTAYKRVSQEQAVHLGLKYFGPKMADMAKQAKKLAPGREVRLHCWRGGMRSQAVQWLLELSGFTVHLLDGGYKAYRQAVLATLAQPRQWWVLGGPTGSGKTEVLHQLAAAGQPVLDLEGLACHKGSSFGGIGQPAAPTQEQFENNLAVALAQLPAHAPAWLEDESRQIGRLVLPGNLYDELRAAPCYVLNTPRAERITRLAAEYGPTQDPALLGAAIERLRKRLGGLATRDALAAVEAGNFELMVALVLDYYDKAYDYGMEQRRAASTPVLPFSESFFDAAPAANGAGSAVNN